MKQYLELMRHVYENGTTKTDRTGTGTQSVFGYQMRFDLADGFPMVTTKKLHLRSIIHELLWFLKGDTNVAYLHDHNVTIWDEWADENGDLGPVYGAQWRSWPAPDGATIDQLAILMRNLRERPDSRRQFDNLERFDDIIVGSLFDRCNRMINTTMGGQYDKRDMRILALQCV